jgi:ferredoxin
MREARNQSDAGTILPSSFSLIASPPPVGSGKGLYLREEDSGEWTKPRCVDACPTAALKFMEEAEAQAFIAKAELLHPEEQTPHVYYLNIPKKFMAGTVYDPLKKEVVLAATCVLTGNGKTLTETTDGFGDFWLEGLEVGPYSLQIAAPGFRAPATTPWILGRRSNHCSMTDCHSSGEGRR